MSSFLSEIVAPLTLSADSGSRSPVSSGPATRRNRSDVGPVVAVSLVNVIVSAGVLQVGAPLWLHVAATACPILIMLACVWSAYRLLHHEPMMMWSPTTWFLLASAAYFGFGPL